MECFHSVAFTEVKDLNTLFSLAHLSEDHLVQCEAEFLCHYVLHRHLIILLSLLLLYDVGLIRSGFFNSQQLISLAADALALSTINTSHSAV